MIVTFFILFVFIGYNVLDEMRFNAVLVLLAIVYLLVLLVINHNLLIKLLIPLAHSSEVTGVHVIGSDEPLEITRSGSNEM